METGGARGGPRCARGKAPALVPAEAWLPLLWAGGGGARVSWEMALRGQALPVGGRGEAHPGPAGLGWGVAGSDDCGSHSGRESSQAGDPSTENGGPGSMSRRVTGAPETVSAPGLVGSAQKVGGGGGHQLYYGDWTRLASFIPHFPPTPPPSFRW